MCDFIPLVDEDEVYIYFIAEPTSGLIKIGKTKRDPYTRLQQIQTGSPYKYTLLGYLIGVEWTEGVLHKKFKHTRVLGEWFEMDYPMLVLIEGSHLTPQGKQIIDGVRRILDNDEEFEPYD